MKMCQYAYLSQQCEVLHNISGPLFLTHDSPASLPDASGC
jgi:hypothetical protein